MHFELDHTGIPHLHKAEITADESSTTSRNRLHSKSVTEESSVTFHESDKKFQVSKEILVAFREYDK